MRKIILFFYCLISFNFVFANTTLDYKLKPKQIAKDTYVFIGKKEDFSRFNGGNIVNTGFIVTDDGIVVIDSGPSLGYGQQMREAIKKVSAKPIKKVILTHHHPDHILGNQAYMDVPIYALPETVTLIKRDASSFLDNVYRMVGDWMRQTEVVTDILPLNQYQEKLGDHVLNYISLSGHTDGDLVIFDETTGVLFAGDLVFNNRALTTPHATPEKWQVNLNKLKKIKFKKIVPGHGEIANTIEPIVQTLDYLLWIESTIKQGVDDGLDMNEVLATPIPERFSHLAVLKHEFTRSVIHRYPLYEKLIFN